MSRPLLLRLWEEHAFDHAPLRHDLGLYHVAYTELTGRSLEERLGRGLRGGECLAVVGVSGSGKSNLIQHVLGPLAEGVAPITVPVAVEPSDRVADVREVVSLVVQAIVDQPETDLRYTDQKEALLGTAALRPTREGASWAGTIGASWKGTGLSLALQRQAPTSDVLNRSAASALESLQTLLKRIGREDLVPVLVFDDTDRWLASPGTPRLETARDFFSKVLPALRGLSASIVVAAQTAYFEDPELRDHLDRTLSDRVEIPSLPSTEALGKVLESRIRWHGGDDRRLHEVIAHEAVERLYGLYVTEFGGSLRRVIGRVHVALTDICESGHERIGFDAIEQAAS